VTECVGEACSVLLLRTGGGAVAVAEVFGQVFGDVADAPLGVA
jgi:hypothetical protein